MLSPVELFKCLSDRTRLFSTLLISEQNELCVCELMEALDMSQPKVSRHLSQLKACGILVDERRGQWVYYALNPALPAWAEEIIRVARESERSAMLALEKNLNSMQGRPYL